MASVYEETLIGACQPLLSCVRSDCPVHICSYADCCHHPGREVVRVQAVILWLSDWVFWAENPYHLVVHGMCCTKFGISVKSPRGRWGTMGDRLVTLDTFICIDHCVTQF